jgi:hypothetical protein
LPDAGVAHLDPHAGRENEALHADSVLIVSKVSVQLRLGVLALATDEQQERASPRSRSCFAR